MKNREWCVRVVCGAIERVRTSDDEAEAITLFRLMSRDARDEVDRGRVREARATLSHRGRLLVGHTMIGRAVVS